MALTPEDVHRKQFTTVRLRQPGYDQNEVDEFLDEVEMELGRLLKELERTSGGAGATADEAPAAVVVAAPATAAPLPPQEIVVRTSADVSAAAAKILDMAQRTAEQYVGEARAEADSLLENAKSEAEQLSAEARSKADAIDRETHERTTELERRLDEQRQSTLDALQDEKRRLESEVETLRSFEREYRGRLRTFLQEQLGQLSTAEGGDTPLAPAGGPDTSHAAVLPTDDAGSDAPSDDSAAALDADDVVSEDEDDAGLDGATPDASTQGGRRTRGGLPEVHRDGQSSDTPRSALGRILAEEERNADGRA